MAKKHTPGSNAFWRSMDNERIEIMRKLGIACGDFYWEGLSCGVLPYAKVIPESITRHLYLRPVLAYRAARMRDDLEEATRLAALCATRGIEVRNVGDAVVWVYDEMQSQAYKEAWRDGLSVKEEMGDAT